MDRFIRLYDPAIDWTSETGTPADTWPITRDESKLVMLPGRTPVVFHAVRLSRKAYEWAMSTPSEQERCFRAFRAGVRRVDLASGPWTPAGTEARGYIAMTEDEADTFGIADHQEIGGLVLERAVLPTDCEGGYSVRPSSRLVWAARQLSSLSAAQSRGERAPTLRGPAAPSEG